MLKTPRLLLRDWQDSDIPPVTALFADKMVMRYFLGTRDAAYSVKWVAGVRAHFAREGFGLWALEIPGAARFIGFTGLSRIPETMPGFPGVEIVWTLAEAFWHQGYATEAAQAALADGFGRLGLPEIVAFTAALNAPSRAVMRKLGMRHHPEDDFRHPRIPADHPLCPHVLYRATSPASLTRA